MSNLFGIALDPSWLQWAAAEGATKRHRRRRSTDEWFRTLPIRLRYMVRAMTNPYGITLDREWTEWAGEQPAVHVQPQAHARKTPARRLASNSSFALMQSLCPLNVSPTCRLLRQFVGQ